MANPEHRRCLGKCCRSEGRWAVLWWTTGVCCSSLLFPYTSAHPSTVLDLEESLWREGPGFVVLHFPHAQRVQVLDIHRRMKRGF